MTTPAGAPSAPTSSTLGQDGERAAELPEALSLRGASCLDAQAAARGLLRRQVLAELSEEVQQVVQAVVRIARSLKVARAVATEEAKTESFL
jgi:hypothetical protein